MRKHTKLASSQLRGVPSDFLALLTGWIQRGIESFSATQRMFGEVAMRQNAVTAKTLREGMPGSEHSPVAILTDLAIEGTSSFMEAQRILLSLAQQQNEIMMSGVKEQIAGSTPGAAMTDLVRRSLDTFIRMQQDFLKVTSKQTRQWLEAVKAGKDFQGAHLVDLAREEMEVFVSAQKKFLDVIAQETSRAATGKHGHAKAVKKATLSKLANEATQSFVDVQKRLLEVVGQQMNVNLKAVTRTMKLASTAQLLPMANLAGEGLKNFVGAEKALIESIVEPGKGTKIARMAKHRPGRAGHPRKAQRLHAARAAA